jgi:hypothetical protein
MLISLGIAFFVLGFIAATLLTIRPTQFQKVVVSLLHQYHLASPGCLRDECNHTLPYNNNDANSIATDLLTK